MAPGLVLPLAANDPAPELNWSEQQKEALYDLWNKFVDEVGESPDLTDEQQQKKWLEAQSRSDMEFKALYGREAYNAFQLRKLNAPSGK